MTHSNLLKVLMQTSSSQSHRETRASALPVAKYLHNRQGGVGAGGGAIRHLQPSQLCFTCMTPCDLHVTQCYLPVGSKSMQMQLAGCALMV